MQWTSHLHCMTRYPLNGYFGIMGDVDDWATCTGGKSCPSSNSENVFLWEVIAHVDIYFYLLFYSFIYLFIWNEEDISVISSDAFIVINGRWLLLAQKRCDAD